MSEDDFFLNTMTSVCRKLPFYMLGCGLIMIPIENPEWFYRLFEKWKENLIDNIEYLLLFFPIISIVLIFGFIWYDPFDELEHQKNFLPTSRKTKHFNNNTCWGQFVETEK